MVPVAFTESIYSLWRLVGPSVSKGLFGASSYGPSRADRAALAVAVLGGLGCPLDNLIEGAASYA